MSQIIQSLLIRKQCHASDHLFCSCPYCCSSPSYFLRCWLSRSSCSIAHSTVTYSGICCCMFFPYALFWTYHQSIPSAIFFTQAPNAMISFCSCSVSLMTTDHFVSTPILVTSLLTIFSKSSMSSWTRRCRIVSEEYQCVLLLLAPHDVFILLKSNTFCLSKKQNYLIKLWNMWIPRHCYNDLIFKLIAFELFCCWDTEQQFWWPVSPMPKSSVLIYSHRRKSEDFGLQIMSRQIPLTCGNMQNWIKIS